MTDHTFGAFDLLKIVSVASRASATRATTAGTTSAWSTSPASSRPTGPDPNRFGLWLDVRSTDCAADPFENESKYPGVKIGARGKPLGDGSTQPVGSFYGYATGIVGLRLFPNPAFDEKAAKALGSPSATTPTRATTTTRTWCGPTASACPAASATSGPSPINPPADPADPKFANLSSTVGAQYMWVDRLFIFNANKPEGRSNFMYQLAHTYRPGSDGHLAGLHRQHQQPAHHERGLRLPRRAWAWPSASGTRSSPAASSTTSSSTTIVDQRPADRVLRQAPARCDAARAEGRRRFGGPAGRAQPRLPQHRPVQRGVAAALQPGRRRQADHADPDRRRRRRTPAYWQATEAGTPTRRCSS